MLPMTNEQLKAEIVRLKRLKKETLDINTVKSYNAEILRIVKVLEVRGL